MTDTDQVYPLDTDSLRQRSIRGAGYTSVSQAAKFFMMFGSQILFARLLNPADFGIVAMVTPVLGFVNVMADLGFTQAIIQRPVLTRRDLNSVFWLNCGFSATVALAVMALAPVLAWLYHEPKLTAVTLAFSGWLIITGFSTQQTALLSRTMRFSVLAFSEIMSLGLGYCAGLLAAWKGLGYWALVIAPGTTSLTSAIVVWTATTWRPSWPSISPGSLSMLRVGGNITVSNIFSYLNTVLDNALIGLNLGAVPLGLYDRAWKLAVLPLSQLMAPINRVAVPTLARLVDTPERYANAFCQMLRIILFVSLPGIAVGILASYSLIEFLFGPKWHNVGPVFSWLCVGALLVPINASTFWLFISQGRSKDQMIFGTATCIINILAYVVGIRWGLIGVAATSAISVYLLQTPLLLWAVSKTGPVTRLVLLRVLYPFPISTLTALAATQLYDQVFGLGTLINLGFAVAVSYGAATLALACFPSGRATISSLYKVAKTVIRPMISRAQAA